MTILLLRLLLAALLCAPLPAAAGSINSGSVIDFTTPADDLPTGAQKINNHWHERDGATLTNKTGGQLVAGDVVAYSGANDSAVILSDSVGARRSFAVAQATIANDAAGEFARSGVVTAKCTGTISRGNYIRKSATTKAVEEGVAEQSSGATIPSGTLGIALSTCAGGFVTAAWFPHVNAPDTLVAGAGITLTPGTGTNTIAANVSGIEFQQFTASGTWTKLAGVTVCLIQAVGGGGSGGGGKSGASSNGGGTGGGGGAIATKFLKASDLGATESVTVGAQTTGGASNASGAAGNTSSFGAHLSAFGGGAGFVGQTTATAGGGAGGGTAGAGDNGGTSATDKLGGAPLRLNGMSVGGGGAGSNISSGGILHGWPAEYGGGSGGGSSNNSAGSDGGTSLYCGGAGAGGGSGGATTASNGGVGGASGVWTELGGGGGAAGTGGASPTAGAAGAAGTTAKCGSGGGGGGGSITGGVTGGAGGNGGVPGGGGGGGGSGVAAGGAGGNGARGEIRTYCW